MAFVTCSLGLLPSRFSVARGGWETAGAKLRVVERRGQGRALVRRTPRSAAESETTSSDTIQEPLPDVPFEIRGFSLGNVAGILGGALTVYSFYTYFSSSGTASATSLGFVYGVPILLIGFALKYAELKPVPVESQGLSRQLREVKATDTQKKIIRDVTRHRYGDEAHLDTSLKALGLIPRGASCPVLLKLVESVRDGQKYALSMEFFSKETPYSLWEEKLSKFDRFFGPDVTCSIAKIDEEKRLVQLTIVSTR
uniref:Thylakoid membrane protein slr0575 n=1 Tax=Compsopogon caeruleus TaxID=31354 RepID=A0A7S1TC68_9RHOD|mmetsp:Transcript_17207/g.35765  ORF Transcript_17207/g.35765 Transcript_17207/m.35765 type:complete len:254 (+) Transcript_17207:107-868(+)|eukprot:CAMPEP_0184682456 /NCGR_PEP_ID=MMETSP0312-20130426/7302_1 /TAXON_ID=31354 /ORGANISM="Compsopogon coeruleus, Strain SAG 36.94" /LENGTH=253 /DNA_ID=CAMNT_0027134141 /DNA_START=41 /DNA_END=802 /DNA_ORIENTATION=+